MLWRCLLVAGALAALASPAKTAPSPSVAHIDHIRVSIGTVEIAPARPDGSAWDSDGTPPDVRLDITVAGDTTTTRTVEAHKASFGIEPFSVSPGTKFVVEVWDVDGRRQELIDRVTFAAGARERVAPFSTKSLILFDVSTRPVDVWVIPEIVVAVAFEIDDPWLERLEAALVELNDRLADVSDGQIRVARFVVRPKPWRQEFDPNAPGVVLLSRKKAATTCSTKRGRPNRPANIDVAIDGELTGLVDTLLHQFGHAYLGLDDSKQTGSLCFMNAAADGGHEACRSSEQRAEVAEVADEAAEVADEAPAPQPDCWSSISAIMAKDVGMQLSGGEPIAGPAPRGKPAIELSYGKTVDLSGPDAGDDSAGQALDPAAINDVLRRSKKPLSECVREGTYRTVRVNFTIRGKDGRVDRLRVNDMSAGALHGCVQRVMKAITFPTFEAPRTTADFEMTR